jgi:hypothetical protein
MYKSLFNKKTYLRPKHLVHIHLSAGCVFPPPQDTSHYDEIQFCPLFYCIIIVFQGNFNRIRSRSVFINVSCFGCILLPFSYLFHSLSVSFYSFLIILSRSFIDVSLGFPAVNRKSVGLKDVFRHWHKATVACSGWTKVAISGQISILEVSRSRFFKNHQLDRSKI